MPASTPRDDDGMAIVIALGVVLVVFLLITAVLGQALYDLSQGLSARRRLQAVNAAEAGLGWYSRVLSSLTVADLVDLPWERISDGTYQVSSGAVTSSGYLAPELQSGDAMGPARFTVTARYFSSIPCAPLVQGQTVSGCKWDASDRMKDGQFKDYLPAPIWVIARSTGQSGSVQRTLETGMQLTPQVGKGGVGSPLYFEAACFSGSPSVIISGDLTLGKGSCPGGGAGFVLPSGATWLQDPYKLSVDGEVKTYPSSCSKDCFVVKSLEAAKDVWLGSQQATGGKGSATCKKPFRATTLVSSMKTVNLDSGTACAGAILSNAPPLTYKASQPYAAYKPSQWGAEWTSVQYFVGSIPSLQVAEPTIFVMSGTCGGQIDLPTGTSFLLNDVAVFAPCGFRSTGKATYSGGTLSLVVTANDCTKTYSTTSLADLNATLYVSTTCGLELKSGVNVNLGGVAKTAWFAGPGTISISPDDTDAPAVSVTSSFLQNVYYVREVSTP